MEEKLLHIAKEILDTEGINLDTPRDKCEEWDSAAHLILLSELEEEMGIEIPLEEVETLKCLRDFLKFAKE